MSFFLLLVSELGLIWLLARRSKSDKKPEGYSQTPVPRLSEVVLKGLPANQAHSVYDGIRALRNIRPKLWIRFFASPTRDSFVCAVIKAFQLTETSIGKKRAFRIEYESNIEAGYPAIFG